MNWRLPQDDPERDYQLNIASQPAGPEPDGDTLYAPGEFSWLDQRPAYNSDWPRYPFLFWSGERQP